MAQILRLLWAENIRGQPYSQIPADAPGGEHHVLESNLQTYKSKSNSKQNILCHSVGECMNGSLTFPAVTRKSVKIYTKVVIYPLGFESHFCGMI